MGSRLGVQRGGSSKNNERKQSLTTTTATGSEFQHQQQFPTSASESQRQTQHHPRAGTTSATRAPTRRSTGTPTTSSTMNNSQRQQQQQQPPPASARKSSMRRDLVRRLSSARSMDSFDSPASQYRNTSTPSNTFSASVAANQQQQLERERRKLEAEKILEEIAKEYAAKRAAGLVPTIPVPARTLLWEELARNERSRVGKRGQCVFGRDTDNICGCLSYKKRRVKGQENPGGICECCNHGAPWHRLAGGSMTQHSSRGHTRSYAGSSVRASRVGSVARSEVPSMYSMGGSEYDDEYYDDDEYSDEDDEDDDDEDIAMEVARPYDPCESQNSQQQAYIPPFNHDGSYPQQQQQQFHQQQQQQLRPFNRQFIDSAPPKADSEYDYNASVDRSSMFSSNSSLGLPPRLSSGGNQLEALLKAIKRYRQLGLAEDEIEARIREDFPPLQRTTNSNRSAVFTSGELASM